MRKPTRRALRTDRMKRRAIIARTARHFREAVAEVLTLADLAPLPAAFLIPPITDEQAAEWQRAWDWTVVNDPAPRRIMRLPQRPVFTPRLRKFTPRGVPRMREHTRSLLINALRSDGTPSGNARVQTLRAFRVLPWEIGFDYASRIAAGVRTRDEILAEFAADAAADLGIIAAELSFHLPEGLELVLSDEQADTDPNGATEQ